MSANETNTDNDAELSPSIVQDSAAPEKPVAPQQVSRLYARYRRDKASGSTQTTSPLSSDPVTSADSLPVRATAPAHLIGDSDRANNERPQRPERGERADRQDREYNRQGQDRPPERGQRRREPSGRLTTVTESLEGDGNPDQPSDPITRPREAEKDIRRSDQSHKRRGPRFEEIGEQSSDRTHLIQEFKPSRHANPAPRQTSGKGADEKKGSLLGWIKSVFTGGDTATDTPSATPSRSPRQGNLGSGQRSNTRNADGRPRHRRRGRRSGSDGRQNRGRRNNDRRTNRED
jgi:hypothetical protein